MHCILNTQLLQISCTSTGNEIKCSYYNTPVFGSLEFKFLILIVVAESLLIDDIIIQTQNILPIEPYLP